jgi:hypothetical protein
VTGDQDAVNTRAAARMVVLGNADTDVLEILGLLPGQAIDAPTRLSAGWFDPASGGLSPRTTLGRAS